MNAAARVFATLAAISLLGGCVHSRKPAASRPPAGPEASFVTGAPAPSPRLIIGRVIAVDPERAYAFVELASDAPRVATTAETELIVRTLNLRESGRVRASRTLRGRTLGTRILSGKPAPGDEVVWLAP